MNLKCPFCSFSLKLGTFEALLYMLNKYRCVLKDVMEFNALRDFAKLFLTFSPMNYPY